MAYAHSFKAKSIHAMDRGNDNRKYEIPALLPISISHISILMLYCNFTDLQRNYKKLGCREMNKHESIKEFIQRNQEIGHWYKLLYEVMYGYGTFVKRGDVFYTGINIPVSFNTYTPWFNCPFSTTVDWNVANRFSEGIGIIVKLEP
eukprot:1128051_1